MLILGLFLGRPRRPVPVQGDTPAQEETENSVDHLDPSDFAKPSGSTRPLGPDDDPEFLRRLNRRIDPEE